MDEAELIQAHRNLPVPEEKRVTRVIRDPALAAAASKCWLYRMTGRVDKAMGFRSYHPFPCRICAINDEPLASACLEFLEWSEGTWSGGRVPVEVEAFRMLPQEDQEHLTHIAQGYKEGPDGRPISGLEPSGRKLETAVGLPGEEHREVVRPPGDRGTVPGGEGGDEALPEHAPARRTRVDVRDEAAPG